MAYPYPLDSFSAHPTEAFLPGHFLLPLDLAAPEGLRHALIGQSGQILATIKALHVRGYADQLLWTPPMRVPQRGIVLPHAPGEHLALLQRRPNQP